MSQSYNCGASMTYVPPDPGIQITWRCELPRGHKSVHVCQMLVTPLAWFTVAAPVQEAS